MRVEGQQCETCEVITGGLIGSLSRPEAPIAGRYRNSVLVTLGRTIPLRKNVARDLAELL